MMGLALFTAFAVARFAVMWSASMELSPRFLVACLGQDAAVAAVFLGVEEIASRRPIGRRLTAVAFWVLVLYAGLNVVVARALSTPVTWPMLKAAGGPLADSIRTYVDPLAVTLVGLVAGAAAVALGIWRHQRRARRLVAAGAVALIAIVGLLAAPTVETHGLHRNAIVTLAESALPAVLARADARDWRQPPFEQAATPGHAGLRGAARGRNVVLIGLESTAAMYLRTFGAAENVMPRLDEMARQALVFDRAYAVSPDSMRSLFSVLCSRYPAFDAPPDAYAAAPCASIARAFRDEGYETALFHSGRFGYLGMESIIRDRGFDVLEDAGDVGGQRESSFGVDEPATVSRMLRWIDTRPAGRRFFVNYLPVAGHHPYEAAAPGAFGQARDLDRYRSALFEGDKALGAFIDGLEARGLYEQTMFVVYGDHGQAFGQHERNFGHTFFLFEENVHVPLLVVMPGVLGQRIRDEAVVSLVDVGPTVRDLMGWTPDAAALGISALTGQARMALFFTDYGDRLAGLRDARWKFIQELGSRRSWLYDLDADDAERASAHAEQSDRVAAYQRVLEGWSAAEKARVLASPGR